MELKTDEHIKKLNTFGVDAKAENFAEIRSIVEFKTGKRTSPAATSGLYGHRRRL